MERRGGFFSLLLCSRLTFNLLMYFEIRRSRSAENKDMVERQGRRTSVHGPGFDDQAVTMTQNGFLR